MNILEILGAARAEEASIWVPCGVLSVSPVCCALYSGKGAED